MSSEQSPEIEPQSDGAEALRRETARESTDRPAIGIRTNSATSPNQLAGAILRMNDVESDIFVVSSVRPSPEFEDFADQLQVRVFSPENTASETVKEAAITFARDAGYPGILWYSDLTASIDFEASKKTLTDTQTYTAEAKYEPTVSDSQLLVGIPAYNEAQAIGDVVKSAKPYADDVLVVDDGSDDGTVSQARAAGATVVTHEKNRGYGGALKTIFEEGARANVDHLVIVDADGQHKPEDISNLVAVQEEASADIVIGSRFTEDGTTDAPLYRRFGLGVVNTLTNLSLGVIRPQSWIADTQSGFRLYSRSAVESLATADDIDDAMSASTDILYHAHHNDFEIEETGVEVRYDVDDANNRNPVAHGITLVMNIVRTVEQDRPVTVLGVPGFLSTLIGTGFAYWTFSNYISSGTFPLGLAVVSISFVLAGLFSGFTSIILHSLNQHFD